MREVAVPPCLTALIAPVQCLVFLLTKHYPGITHSKTTKSLLEMDGLTECRSGRFVHRLAQSRMGMNGCFDLFERRFEGDG